MALLVIAFIVAVNVKRTSRNNGETIHLKETQKNSPEEKVQPQDYRGVASRSTLNKTNKSKETLNDKMYRKTLK